MHPIITQLLSHPLDVGAWEALERLAPVSDRSAPLEQRRSPRSTTALLELCESAPMRGAPDDVIVAGHRAMARHGLIYHELRALEGVVMRHWSVAAWLRRMGGDRGKCLRHLQGASHWLDDAFVFGATREQAQALLDAEVASAMDRCIEAIRHMSVYDWEALQEDPGPFQLIDVTASPLVVAAIDLEAVARYASEYARGLGLEGVWDARVVAYHQNVPGPTRVEDWEEHQKKPAFSGGRWVGEPEPLAPEELAHQLAHAGPEILDHAMFQRLEVEWVVLHTGPPTSIRTSGVIEHEPSKH